MLGVSAQCSHTRWYSAHCLTNSYPAANHEAQLGATDVKFSPSTLSPHREHAFLSTTSKLFPLVMTMAVPLAFVSYTEGHTLILSRRVPEWWESCRERDAECSSNHRNLIRKNIKLPPSHTHPHTIPSTAYIFNTT
ncbi:hypothetical protein BCV69DRAFT_128070 [Microstroma glucosiphilum]|uniref:Uncharacterized protein n=1 Tax=Pseudomicrostroma glucosiphilum TaxID=1684307 RepID=A0A316TW35_9BASI|nr:hypothetical protein BCV69DRAFT_128070 [Pseudomicrostroma glucosiphilum]PWN17729.1 hypothetical protein BCV69DRAFT_128070 [Pseudomicrostroma glucosiphilum]